MANEKRLIDANALMEQIEEQSYLVRSLGKVNGKGMFNHTITKIIKDAPTVDAVEVVHGEWIVCGDGEYVPFMCSACGKTTSWYHAQTANYCPNCGAKMDGDVNA